MADKDVEGVLQALEPVLAEVVVTRSSSTRGMEPSELAETGEDVFGEDRVHVVERLDEAIATAVDLAEPRRARAAASGVPAPGSSWPGRSCSPGRARVAGEGEAVRNPKRLMAATTLGSEALIVFFATLVAYGLVPMEQRSATYLVVGGVLVLLCLLAAGMLRRRGGYALGWVLQVVIIAGGFVVPVDVRRRRGVRGHLDLLDRHRQPDRARAGGGGMAEEARDRVIVRDVADDALAVAEFQTADVGRVLRGARPGRVPAGAARPRAAGPVDGDAPDGVHGGCALAEEPGRGPSPAS